MEIKFKQRTALSVFFFLSGFCFATWASRIPTIKTTLDINEAELGSLLFVMPVSSLIGLPVSGWLISKFDSRRPMVIGFILHVVSLFFIGLSNNIILVALSVFFFAFFMRIFSIAMNTQSITLQKKYNKRINGSFHGLWSLGGIGGAGFCTLLIALNVSVQIHLFLVSSAIIISTLIFQRNLISGDRSDTGNKLQMGKPDPQMLLLGLLALLASICEGGMFDWSGVYFEEVIKVEIFTAGYLIFMTFMALSRFSVDFIVNKIGMKSMYMISSVLICFGISIAVLFPDFWPAMVGFSLVGIGTAAVIPMTFLLAGTSEKYSPGIALSIIVTYAMVGVLFGPVIIGYIAHTINLRGSFVFMALAGLAMLPTSRYYFKKYGRLDL